MLNIITYKDISKSEILEYRKHEIGIYDATNEMIDPEPSKFYYGITSNAGCACNLYQGDPGNGYKIIELLTECVQLGEVVLFFYWDDGDYEEIWHDVHSYINRTKQVRISLDDFLYDFLTKQFEGNGIVFIITK
jgi:hypothetical protein